MSRDSAPPRSADQIAAELEAKRLRLAGTIAQLETRVSPKAVADKQVAKARAFFMTKENKPDWAHIGMAAGAVVGVAVGIHMTSRTVRWLFAMPGSKLHIDTPKVVYVPVSREALSKAATEFARAA